jgi:hypothetical protein
MIFLLIFQILVPLISWPPHVQQLYLSNQPQILSSAQNQLDPSLNVPLSVLR